MATVTSTTPNQHTVVSKERINSHTTFDRHGWGFAFLTLVVATLFLRPTDLLPDWRDAPIYQWLIVTAVLFSYRAIGEQLSQRKIASRPVTACLILFIAAVACSHLANGFFWGARNSAWMVTKVFVLYLLVVGLLNTPKRLELFTRWLVIAITIMSALALCDKFDYIKLSAFSPIEDSYAAEGVTDGKITRLRGSGLFEDPNDLGLVVVVGIIMSAYFLLESGRGWPRYVWIVPLVILGIALGQTYSRGAFLALAVAFPAWFYYHRGLRTAFIGSMAIIPVVALAFSGRMTEVNSMFEGTGQSRIQIWSDSFQVFRNSPIFGIGEGRFAEEFGLVSHNSFLQSYAELGFIGGTIFIAVFLSAIVGLLPDNNSYREQQPDSTPTASVCSIHMRGAIFTVLVSYTIGIQTLSRQFVAPTYLILGLAVATQMLSKQPIPEGWMIGNKMALRTVFAGCAFLAMMYTTIRLLINSI